MLSIFAQSKNSYYGGTTKYHILDRKMILTGKLKYKVTMHVYHRTLLICLSLVVHPVF